MQLYKISKNYLIMIAGLVWIFAGTMIINIGLPILLELINVKIIWLLYSLIIFLIFYKFIFSKLVSKHVQRVSEMKDEKANIWQFFDLKSYIIMFFMMSLGIALRSFHLVPSWFIGFFYTGLGSALFLCGALFVYNYFIIYKRSKTSIV